MLVLITYDVETGEAKGQKRLRKVAKCCQNYGRRVQNSVFECVISEEQAIRLKSELSILIDAEKDSIRFYFLGNNYLRKVEQIGKETTYDISSELII